MVNSTPVLKHTSKEWLEIIRRNGRYGVGAYGGVPINIAEKLEKDGLIITKIEGKQMLFAYPTPQKSKALIAVDLHGTIGQKVDPEAAPVDGMLPEYVPQQGAVDALQQLKDQGHEIAVWTCWSTDDAKAWLNSYGIPHDYVNQAPAEFDTTSPKIDADAYIDDKAVEHTGDWADTLERLEGSGLLTKSKSITIRKVDKLQVRVYTNPQGLMAERESNTSATIDGRNVVTRSKDALERYLEEHGYVETGHKLKAEEKCDHGPNQGKPGLCPGEGAQAGVHETGGGEHLDKIKNSMDAVGKERNEAAENHDHLRNKVDGLKQELATAKNGIEKETIQEELDTANSELKDSAGLLEKINSKHDELKKQYEEAGGEAEHAIHRDNAKQVEEYVQQNWGKELEGTPKAQSAFMDFAEGLLEGLGVKLAKEKDPDSLTVKVSEDEKPLLDKLDELNPKGKGKLDNVATMRMLRQAHGPDAAHKLVNEMLKKREAGEGKHMKSSPVRKHIDKGEVVDVGDDAHPIVTYVMTTGDVDADDETVNPLGGDFSRFALNPVLIYNHDTDEFPIGSFSADLAGPIPKGREPVHPKLAVWQDEVGEGTDWPQVEGPRRAALMGRAKFDLVDDQSKTAYGKIKAGTFKGGSISFDPMGPVTRGHHGGTHYAKWKLLEMTACSVGSNPSAVAVAIGKSLKALSTKDPGYMSNSEIKKENEKLSEISSKLADELIAEGRGHQSNSQAAAGADPLSRRVKEVIDRRSQLLVECGLRGVQSPSKLPMGRLGSARLKSLPEGYATDTFQRPDGWYWTVEQGDKVVGKSYVPSDTEERAKCEANSFVVGGRKAIRKAAKYRVMVKENGTWKEVDWSSSFADAWENARIYRKEGKEVKVVGPEGEFPMKSFSHEKGDARVSNTENFQVGERVYARKLLLTPDYKTFAKTGNSLIVVGTVSGGLWKVENPDNGRVITVGSSQIRRSGGAATGRSPAVAAGNATTSPHKSVEKSDEMYEVKFRREHYLNSQDFDSRKDAEWFVTSLKKDKEVTLIRLIDRLRNSSAPLVEWERDLSEPGGKWIRRKSLDKGYKNPWYVDRDPRTGKFYVGHVGLGGDPVYVPGGREEAEKEAQRLNEKWRREHPSKSLKPGDPVYSLLDHKLTTLATRMPDGGFYVHSSDDWHHPSQVLSLEDFAKKVKAVAGGMQGWEGGKLVFISHVYRKFGSTMPRPVFDEMLVDANRAGLLRLSRADLPEAMDSNDVQESETRYANATFNFINKGFDMNTRKMYRVGKTAVLLKSDGPPSEATAEYLEQRGLDDVNVEDKAPDDFDEMEHVPAEKAEAESDPADNMVAADLDASTAKAEELMEEKDMDAEDAVEEALDGAMPEDEKKLRSLKHLVLKRIKRFVVKVGGKGYLKALDIGTVQSDPEEPMKHLTKDLDEAEHTDEKSAKKLVAKMAEGEWPAAKVVEDLTGWENKDNPPAGPDSMGNASKVEDKWPAVDSSEANIHEVAKALEDDGMDEDEAKSLARKGLEACAEGQLDPEDAMKHLKAEGEIDEDEEKALRKALKRVQKRSSSSEQTDTPWGAKWTIPGGKNGQKWFSTEQEREKFIDQLRNKEDDANIVRSDPRKSLRKFIVKTRKGFVYKSGTVASADDAEQFTKQKAEEVAEEQGGEVEEKGIESAATGQLDPEDPMKALRKSVGAKRCRLAATLAKRLKVKVCKDCVGEKALCSKCVAKVLKADPLEGNPEDEQGVPVGLRSLRKLCKAMEEEGEHHEFGPVKEAIEMALKVLGKTRTKLYKDLESDDEVEKRLHKFKALQWKPAGAHSWETEYDDGLSSMDLKELTQGASKGKFVLSELNDTIGRYNSRQEAERAAEDYARKNSIKAIDDDDDLELKSDEPPTIEEKSDGYVVKRGDKVLAGPFKSKSQAVSAFRTHAYKRVKQILSAKVRKALIDTKALLQKAQEDPDLGDGLKGLMMLKTKELDDALGEEEKAEGEEEMTDFDKMLFRTKAAEMEDQMKETELSMKRAALLLRN